MTPGSNTEVARPALLEAGLFLIVVATPLVFFPLSFAPYVDPKLLAITLGVLFLSISGLSVDLRLCVAASLWVATLILAALAGVDPWWSILGSPDQDASGVLLLTSCAGLLVFGSGIPKHTLERIPRWLLTAGTVVAVVALLERFLPAAMSLVRLGDPSIPGSLSTLGQPLLLGGFLAAVIVAATALPLTRFRIAALITIASGLSVAVNRAGLIAVLLGLIVIGHRTSWRSAGAVGAIVLLLGIGWSAGDAVARRVTDVRSDAALSPALRFAELGPGSPARQRPHYWSGSLRAWLERPVLGWGPGTTSGAFLASATPADIRGSVGRELRDAHNLYVESLTTTGILGTIPLLALSVLVVLRGLRGPPWVSWAAGVAVALLFVHLVQPRSVALTPLLFLSAGMATGPPRRTLHVQHILVPAAAVLLVLATMRFTASTLERYGRDYSDLPALSLAHRIEPLRSSSMEALALEEGVDARMRVPGAAERARRTATLLVNRHQWSPNVRLTATDVELLLDDPRRARIWTEQHLVRFPNDPVALTGAAILALEAGETEAAMRYARRALVSRPWYEPAQRILRDAAPTSGR